MRLPYYYERYMILVPRLRRWPQPPVFAGSQPGGTVKSALPLNATFQLNETLWLTIVNLWLNSTLWLSITLLSGATSWLTTRITYIILDQII